MKTQSMKTQLIMQCLYLMVILVNYVGARELGFDEMITKAWDSSLDESHLKICSTQSDPSFLVSLDANRGYTSDLIWEDGFYCETETAIFMHVLKACQDARIPPVVVDVGANVGWFSGLAATMGCRVIAFEPNPSMTQFLNKTLHLNDPNSKFHIYVKALGEATRRMLFTLHDDWSLSSAFATQGRGSLTEVDVLALDDVIKDDILLLKVDTEGYESRVLQGASALMEKGKVQNLLVEFKEFFEKEWKLEFLSRIQQNYTIYAFDEVYKGSQKHIYELKSRFKQVLTNEWPPMEDIWMIKKA